MKEMDDFQQAKFILILAQYALSLLGMVLFTVIAVAAALSGLNLLAWATTLGIFALGISTSTFLTLYKHDDND